MNAVVEETQEERIKRLNLEYLEQSFRVQEDAKKLGLYLGEDGRVYNPRGKRNPVNTLIIILLPILLVAFGYLLTRAF